MKISRKILFYFTSILFVTSFSMANAGTYSVNYDAGTLQDASAISNFATTGADMDGMNVGITYGDGSTTSAIWGNFGISSGQASWGNGFLELTGDSYISSWNLVAQAGITSILLDAGSGNSLFDTTFGDDWGTSGTAQGRTFSLIPDNGDYNITATYIGLIGVAGNAPVGDIYRYLRLDFDRTFLGSLWFNQDTDNLRDISPVPVPAAAWLFGSALLGFFGFSRRKTQA